MADSYCTDADVYAFGLPRGAVPNPGRRAASALATTDTVTLDVHGFEDGDSVRFRAEAGGNLPAPLVDGATYYVRTTSESTFKVAATAGGAAIDLTSDGVRVTVLAPLPIAEARDWASRLLDDMLPAHAVPLTAPYPPIVVMTVAELAAGKLAARAGSTSKALSEVVDAATKRIQRWATSLPVRGENSPARANLSASAAFSDSIGWGRFGGL